MVRKPKEKKLTAAQEAERATWQYRAVEMTKGNQTLPGCILLAVLQRSSGHGPPRFGHHAIIDADGHVLSHYQGRDRQMTPYALVCHVNELVDTFRKLADACRMEMPEREEMFAEIRRWMAKDLRTAGQSQLFTH